MTEQPLIADSDVFITRTFDAPRDVVWKFWTRPEYLAMWFGPEGISVPVESVVVDPEVGGRWDLTMVDDATGEGFLLRTVITEIVENELLVGRLDADTGVGQISVILRVQFHDHGDRTRITLHQGPFTAEQREMTAGGWEMSFVKLDTIFAAKGAPA